MGQADKGLFACKGHNVCLACFQYASASAASATTGASGSLYCVDGIEVEVALGWRWLFKVASSR